MILIIVGFTIAFIIITLEKQSFTNRKQKQSERLKLKQKALIDALQKKDN
jgi:phosphate/sulfate permease